MIDIKWKYDICSRLAGQITEQLLRRPKFDRIEFQIVPVENDAPMLTMRIVGTNGVDQRILAQDLGEENAMEHMHNKMAKFLDMLEGLSAMDGDE